MTSLMNIQWPDITYEYLRPEITSWIFKWPDIFGNFNIQNNVFKMASYILLNYTHGYFQYSNYPRFHFNVLKWHNTSSLKLACFMCNLKLSTLLKKNATWEIIQEIQKWHWNFSVPGGFRLGIKHANFC